MPSHRDQIADRFAAAVAADQAALPTFDLDDPQATCWCDTTIVKVGGHVWIHRDTGLAPCYPDGADDPDLVDAVAEPAG